MKSFLIGAAALLIAASSPALADHHHGAGGGGGRPGGGMHAGGGGMHGGAGGMRMGGGHTASHFGGGSPRASRDFRVHSSGGRTARHFAPAHHFASTHHVHLSSHRSRLHATSHHVRLSAHHAHIAVRGGHPVAARVDGNKLHRVFHATRRFHAGSYNRPYGWYSYDWRLGQRLPRGWFGREYWIGDWGLYGLFAPPDGLVWVRVGPDALLVDEDTGEVIDIYYDLFW